MQAVITFILVGSCQGDSGSPLSIFNPINPSQQIQIGVVSAGPHMCGAFDAPGIYTKVESYTDWILDNVDFENME